MLKIKLLPRGKKHQITYRIVVAECRSKSDGKFIDDIGFYIPQTKALEINQEKMTQWQKNGAQLTMGVDKLINPDKYPKKIKNVKEEKKSNPEPVEMVESEVKEETVEVVNSEPAESTPVEKVKPETTSEEKSE